MPWKTIINFIMENDENAMLILERFQKKYSDLYDEADIYIMNVMVYSNPVDNS